MKLERAVIEVAGGCNYSCAMCPHSDPGRGKEWTRIMPLDMFEDILDQITPKYGTPIINLEGSGEPTMNKRLPEYVEAVTKRGLKSYMYSNGSFLRGDFMKDVVDAGLGFMRFSFIGYNRETYKQWMSIDNFDLVKDNAIKLKEYIVESGSECEVSSYHLILNNRQIEFEVEEYRRNVINKIGTIGYIWKMHNWSGNYKPSYGREKDERRTCGRPFAPEITIRAGGNNGQTGAVTPCCQTLGPPNEAKSVLGHFSEQSFEEIYFGEKYEELRKLHKEKRFDEIDYCKDCDFLYEDPEVLVWSNDSKASVNRMIGTNFSLKDYM
jgi:radical SAM protein with 4Fe4S-binding SPASM domain